MSRPKFLRRSALAVGGLATSLLVRRPIRTQGAAPAVVTPDAARHVIPYGVQGSDAGDRAIAWSRTDRPARLLWQWATEILTVALDDVIGKTLYQVDLKPA